MNKNLKHIFALGLGVLSFTACTGDLNTEPLTDQTLTPEKALANEGSYDQFISKIYSAFSLAQMVRAAVISSVTTLVREPSPAVSGTYRN